MAIPYIYYTLKWPHLPSGWNSRGYHASVSCNTITIWGRPDERTPKKRGLDNTLYKGNFWDIYHANNSWWTDLRTALKSIMDQFHLHFWKWCYPTIEYSSANPAIQHLQWWVSTFEWQSPDTSYMSSCLSSVKDGLDFPSNGGEKSKPCFFFLPFL